jgi:phytoene/squalene synthetase
MADDAFASFERKWLDANPEQAAVLVFLGTDERRRASAFGALIHELAHTTFAVRETQIAAAKLSWWQQELRSAAGGNPRHPISIELFGDARVRAVDAKRWIAIADGALSQLDESSAGDFPQLLNQFGRFYVPVAAVENELIGARTAPAERVADLWMCSHFMSALASGSPLAEHFSLPLDVFARHGVARAAAGQGEKHKAILRDFIGNVRTTLEAAFAASPDASIGRRIRARSDLKLATTAMKSDNPADALSQRSQKPTPRQVWWAWREARRRT